MATALVLGCGARTGLSVDPPMDAGEIDACIVPALPPILASCALDASSTADVRGRTPLGEVTLTHAWAGAGDGSCPSDSLVLAPERFLRGFGAFPVERFPSITVAFLPPDDIGTFEAVVAVHDGCRRFETRGTVTLARNDATADDPRDSSPRTDDFCACDESWVLRFARTCATEPSQPEVAGTLTVEGDGWSLRGAFVAPHCHLLHRICI